MLSQLWQGVRRHFAGFTAANFRQGLQLMVGWAATLAVAAPPGVWNRLSTLGASPAIILMMCSNCMRDSTGATMLVAGVSVTGAVAGAGLGFVPIYLAFAAAGGSWTGDAAAKGVTLVAATAVLSALLAAARMRFEAADPFFYVLLLMLSSFCFAAYWIVTPAGVVALPDPPYQMSYTLLLTCVLPLAVALPVSWLLWPQPAGRQAKGCFCRLVSNVGELAAGTAEALVGQQAPGEDAVARLQSLDESILQDLGGLRMLLLLSRLELDLFGQQKVLPVKAYKQAATSAAAAAAALAQLVRWIQQLPGAPAPAALPADKPKGSPPGALAVHTPVRSAAASAATAAEGRHEPADRAGTGAAAVAAAAAGEAVQKTTVAVEGQLAPLRAPDFEVCRQLAPQLLALSQALQGCCKALAAVVTQKQRVEAALPALERMEHSCAELVAVAAAGHGGSRRAVAVFLIARGLMFAACSQVREMYAGVAAAVEGLQPGSQAAVAAHFERSTWGTGQLQTAGSLAAGTSGDEAAGTSGDEADQDSEDGEAEEAGKLFAAAAEVAACTKDLERSVSTRSKSGGGSSDGSCISPPQTSDTEAAAQAGASLDRRARTALSTARPPAFQGSATAGSPLRRALERAGLGPLQLLPALHMALLITMAGALVVVRPVFEALGGSTEWCIITVIAASERSCGRSRIRAANRLLGTCAGVAWSVASLGLAYCINGLSLHNSPTKYAALAVLTSLWGGFVGLYRGRYKQLDYAWTVMGITVPIVCVESFKSEQPLHQAKWRIVCVCIGIVLELAVTSFVFPVTTDMLLQDKLCAALAATAQLAEGVAAREAAGSSADAGAEHAASSKGLPLAGLEDGGEAAEAGMAQQPLQLQEWQQDDVPSLESLQEHAQQARAALAGLVSLSSYSVNSPLPLLPAARRRHAAVLATRGHLSHLANGLQLVAYARQEREARCGPAQQGRQGQGRQPAGLHPQDGRLVAAVGAALAGSLRALRAVLSGDLPLSAALSTLRVLDALLCELAAASGAELELRSRQHKAVQKQQQAGSAVDGWLAVPQHGAASLLPFTAVALDAAQTLRGLFHSSVELLLAGDPAAQHAVEAESLSDSDTAAALLAARKAALGGALRTLT